MKKREPFEVINRRPKPCSTIPLIHENKSNPFDLIPLATCVPNFRDIKKERVLQNFTQNIEQRDVRLSNIALDLQVNSQINNFLQNKERDV